MECRKIKCININEISAGKNNDTLLVGFTLALHWVLLNPHSIHLLDLLPATKPGGFFVEKPEIGSPEEKIEKS